MSRRTSVVLEEDIYERLVEESLRRYGTTRAISRVLNELLRESLRGEADLLRLIYSEKVARTTAREFEEFRRELSKRTEQ